MKKKTVPPQSGITAPLGFTACGVEAGIKRKNRKDMALLASELPASVAGVFTTNRVQAAPVLLCKRHLAGGIARAILVNSGNANACTGRKGAADALEMARMTADLLRVDIDSVFVCSTGTIGVPMPMQTVRRGARLAVASLSRQGGPDAAAAIMTTDTRPKQAVRRLKIDGRVVTVAGMAKGSGMISPKMATMLAFLTTDAKVAPKQLQECLSSSVRLSFNSITVDGDQSTNDTVLFMANGASGGKALGPRHPAWKFFCAAVNDVCMELAMMIVRDGEGATKFVSVTVKGAASEAAAEKVARAVACSPLVKTSWCGADPNWGRVICAVGYSGAEFEPGRIDIALNGKPMVKRGQSAGVPEQVLRKIMSAAGFTLEINLHGGRSAFTIHTCDLSDEYIKINASYMT